MEKMTVAEFAEMLEYDGESWLLYDCSPDALEDERLQTLIRTAQATIREIDKIIEADQ